MGRGVGTCLFGTLEIWGFKREEMENAEIAGNKTEETKIDSLKM